MLESIVNLYHRVEMGTPYNQQNSPLQICKDPNLNEDSLCRTVQALDSARRVIRRHGDRVRVHEEASRVWPTV